MLNVLYSLYSFVALLSNANLSIVAKKHSGMTHPLFTDIMSAFAGFIENTAGTRPAERCFRLTRDGLLSLNAFVRGGSKEACEALSSRRDGFLWRGALVFACVREENGWLIFTLTDGFHETLAGEAADLPAIPRDDFVSLRLKMLMRKGPAPCPADARVHEALLCSLFAAEKGVFTQEDDRRILTMTHHKRGMERLCLENACGTAAKALLMLRGRLPR